MYPDIVATSAALDETLRPDVIETGLVRRPVFDRGERRVLAKLENTQHTGSFKLRGATAKLKSLSPGERAAGVVTASTGNHGAAVARAGGLLDTAVEVFVSTEADPSKLVAIRSLGATITAIPGDPVLAEVAARDEAARTRRTYVPPYNDATVIAGQGTIGVELTRRMEQPAAVVVSVGGGGLIAGIAATVRHHWPDTRVVGASAANSAAMHHSVAAGSIIDVDHSETLSDGTAGGIEAQSITFEMCRTLVADWILVSEADIAAAMRAYMSNYPDRIEGSAGVALAALDHIDVAGSVVAIICGRKRCGLHAHRHRVDSLNRGRTSYHPPMTSTPAAAIGAVLDRVDWLADRGSWVMRAAAAFTWLGAIAATVVVFTELGAIGRLLGVICLIPGWILWRYGKRLESALDAEKIKGQLDDVADLAKTRLAEVVGGIQTSRSQIFRGGLQVIKSVRALRADLGDFGIDVSDLTRLANPGSIAMAVTSLFIGLGLWVLVAIGVAFRTVL